MEALAILCVLRYSKDFAFSRMIIESDSSRVIKKISNDRAEISYLNDIIEDCRVFSRDFEDVAFVHVSRVGNKVAYGLTELVQSMEFNVPTFWMDEIHFSLIPLLVSNDLE